MKDRSETPFDSVEGAHEYLSLLSEAIQDAKNEIEADIRTFLSMVDPGTGYIE